MLADLAEQVIARGYATKDERLKLLAERKTITAMESMRTFESLLALMPDSPAVKTILALRAAYKIIDSQVTHRLGLVMKTSTEALPADITIAFDELRLVRSRTQSVVLTNAAARTLIRIAKEYGFDQEDGARLAYHAIAKGNRDVS